jgi:hypothetical protein
MEGYFWRFTHRASGRVIVALCGVNRAADGSWATVALVGHPGGFLRDAAVMRAGADPTRLGAWAGGAFAAGPDRVTIDLGADARLDATLHDVQGWPRRAFGGVGVAHAIPGLSQYWHPHVLGGRVTGRAVLGDTTVDLEGFDVYAEKNWGRAGFPAWWWWGQAQGFARDDACVAFAGGQVRLGPVRTTATAVVVRLGATLVRLSHPVLSPVRADVGPEHWRLRGRGPAWSVDVEAHAPQGAAHLLPVPVPSERRNVLGAHEHLGGRLHLLVRRRGRVVFAGESALAGLEHGSAPDAAGLPDPGVGTDHVGRRSRPGSAARRATAPAGR